MPTDLASFPLVPYSNRIAQGRFCVAGMGYELPRNFPACENPLHGLGWIRPWLVLERRPDRCILGFNHPGDRDWPWAFNAIQEVSLTDTGLELRLALFNCGDKAMPYGIGQHPYVCRPPGTRITAPVTAVWSCDKQQVPTERIALPPHWNLPRGSCFDSVFVDHCFTGLAGEVKVDWTNGSRLRLSSSPTLPFLVLYSQPERDFICIEQVSHRPNAFNGAAGDFTDSGHATLLPGRLASVVHRFQ